MVRIELEEVFRTGRLDPYMPTSVQFSTYHVSVHDLAQKLLHHIRKQSLLHPGDRVGVAVSGGADSVALLRLLLVLRKELGIVLSVVHFNHKLRDAESDADEEFVGQLAKQHKLQLHCGCGNVRARVAEKHLSIEAAARQLRYEYFEQLLREGLVDRITTAHTLDDQAETVLLKIARGAGTRGLAGIYPQLPVASSQFPAGGPSSSVPCRGTSAAIVRPLLCTRRKELDAYLAALGQDWREDQSNRDLRYARNRVRHGILPRMERNLNPAVREALAETAEIARAEEEYWQQEVARVLPLAWKTAAGRGMNSGRDAGATLNLPVLLTLPLALQRRMVRAAGESLGLHLEFRHVEEVLEVAGGHPSCPKSAALPHDWMASRVKNEVRFELAGPAARTNSDYEYPLSVPGQVEVPELGTRFEAVLVSAGSGTAYNPDQSLDPALLQRELSVRSWRAGDRFWPSHTKVPRKIKELLQERHITGAERKLWPVVANESQIVWVRGFSAPAQLRPRQSAKKAVVIREEPL